ncbi:MAG: protein kinase [Acidobacteria bacterium]|nr:protein kinase [Acidobacteriota bacterium]
MGKEISHYRLEDEIGFGGMGRVYKAYDTSLDRTVVLKLLAPELVAEAASRQRFLREARLASALDHQNICTIYEIAEVDKQYFIAMQYLPGKTLKKLIGSKPFGFEAVLSIGLQIADALAAAHAKGIVHRDIKSSNIIITPKGQAKVLDFGLAKLLNEKGRATDSGALNDDLTKVGSPLGTPTYMSPEQARGERVDHRSDIYSFGVVLYEMATGRLPIKGNTTVDTMHAVLHKAHKPAKEVNANLPQEFSDLLDLALAKKPGDRYQSMQRLIEDLQRLSLSLRVGVPDGITVPYVSPQRQTGGKVTRFINRLFARESNAETLRVAMPVPTPASDGRLSSPDSTQEFSFTSGPKKLLAVLPFRNLSGDPEADFYGLSLADSLITELANANQIIVTPSSRVAKYQNQSVDPAEVRADLNVDVILMGNFLKAGDHLRVTAQLIDAGSGSILWSEKIDADIKDAIAIQDRISARIIAGLSGGQRAVDPTEMLKDDDEMIRLDAIHTLEYSHDPRALSALLEALRDKSLKVKAEAARVIVKHGHQATGPVIGVLNDATDEGDNLTARFAAKALGLIGDKSIAKVLEMLLHNDDKFVACEAALALGRLGETAVVPELLKLLEDFNGNVRFAAAEALGQMRDRRAIEALKARLKDEDEGVRAKARWALSRLKKVKLKSSSTAAS